MAKNFKDFKSRRESLLLTQEDVAKGMNVSIRTVANWDVGDGPSKKTAIEIEKYFNDIERERREQGVDINKQAIPDRGFFLEVHLRNIQWQMAKDRARSAGEPQNWKVYLAEIDADIPEVVKDLLDKTAILKALLP